MQHATECSAEPYEPPSRSNMKRQSMHLTNYSVAKCGPHARVITPCRRGLRTGYLTNYAVDSKVRCAVKPPWSEWHLSLRPLPHVVAAVPRRLRATTAARDSLSRPTDSAEYRSCSRAVSLFSPIRCSAKQPTTRNIVQRMCHGSATTLSRGMPQTTCRVAGMQRTACHVAGMQHTQSLRRYSSAFVHADNPADGSCGTKRILSATLAHLERNMHHFTCDTQHTAF